MTSLKGLYKKELKLSFNSFIIGIVIINIAAIIGLALKQYFAEPFIPAWIFVVLFGMFVFFLPATLFNSLQIEAQTQLWLHNPNHGAKMFLAKLLAGLSYFVILLFLVNLLLRLSFNDILHMEQFAIFAENLWSHLLFFSLGITTVSIYFSFWLIFYWTLYNALKSHPVLRPFRLPIVIAVWFGLGIVGNFIESLPIYRKLLSYGSIQLDLSIPFTYFSFDLFEFNWIGLLFFLIHIVIFFSISVWLLERKVEV